MTPISRPSFLQGVVAAAAMPFAQTKAGQFLVFWRPGGAQINVLIEGHVGFAFQISDWEFIAGSVEMAHGDISPAGKDFFFRATSNPELIMGASNNVSAVPQYQTRYDFYKSTTVAGANPSAARKQLDKIRGETYVVAYQDCLSAVRDVFLAYGGHFSDYGLFTRGPSDFFRTLRTGWSAAVPIVIPWPSSTLDASFYGQFDREGLRDDIVNTDPSAVVHDNFTPDLGSTPDDPSYSSQSSLLVRVGYAVVYENTDCDSTGRFVAFNAANFSNLRDVGWQAKSYCLSATAFDPHQPPISNAPARFASDAERARYIQTLQQRDAVKASLPARGAP
jgi:hypothetical protein